MNLTDWFENLNWGPNDKFTWRTELYFFICRVMERLWRTWMFFRYFPNSRSFWFNYPRPNPWRRAYNDLRWLDKQEHLGI